MEFLEIIFPVSGVKINILLPPLVALIISFFTSMCGISGAFLLLPFQMSVLKYTAPSVSGTNHVFNIVAIPSGVYRYIREGRMAWPLTWVVVAGTLPGVFLGFYIRVVYLPDPRAFKLFVGCVLLYIGIRLLYEIIPSIPPLIKGGEGGLRKDKMKFLDEKFRARLEEIKKQRLSKIAAGIPPEAVVKKMSVSLKKIEYKFWDERFSFNPVVMFVLSFVIGIIGGAYGIGGGAIIAPFCISVLHLPAYTIAGATLMGTFITSVAGTLFYSIPLVVQGASSMPDWLLGILFGIGGSVGMYLGARFQKFVPQKFIKLLLGAVILLLSLRYIFQFFMK